MKRTIIITSVVVALAVVAMIVINKLGHKEDLSMIFTEVQKGGFEIVVTTTGELQAERSLEIKGPEQLGSRNLRFGSIKIQDLVPEGTVVKEGDYVATLNRSDADNSLKDELDRQETYETELLKQVLDTTISLGNLRDDLVNLKYAMEEAEITLEQSKFEPPTTIRQAQISLDKAKRTYEQTLSNYDLKVQQAKADIKDTQLQLAKQRRKVQEMQEVISQFTIVAPAAGMVIYEREWGGAKRKVGSEISAWDAVVATLPDLSSMISKTYVNEIDISKVKVGQKVRLTVDAFPEKSYTGVVSSVANIGEQLPNTDAKVFEVITKVDGSDPILRPSMTTGNQVITQTFNDVLYIPLETVFATVDSIPFVYKKDGTRQIVVLGESNENDVIVEQGLKEGEKLFLSIPEKGDRFKLVGEDLVAAIKEKKKLKAEEERRARLESQKPQDMPGMMPGMDPEKMKEFVKNMTPEQREAMKKMRESFQGGMQQGRPGGAARRDSGTTPPQGAPAPQDQQVQKVVVKEN